MLWVGGGMNAGEKEICGDCVQERLGGGRR